MKKNSPSIQQKILESVNKAILVVDQRHPGTIEFQGKDVKVTSKQFWLLAALADSPGKCVSYDALYNKVWGDEVSVELQQLSYHKSQLLKKISRVAPKSNVKTLITPISGEGMVLNLRRTKSASDAHRYDISEPSELVLIVNRFDIGFVLFVVVDSYRRAIRSEKIPSFSHPA